ncbi:FAD binding domain-containing protein [Desulfoscipio gibsoniae]|uniref:Aerobic-type carbon monoxide dehydrogenase, middle subunit CoxM/CutM-like protein n=1 Tax=Desulfoscipio gibsoniae DSM 7213 TaxID=767817 RepID=R4KAU5_9FIRM|nr:xanthine dehydrogenase family protein subunit M [Desulfoscipio gibsoniae]AGL00308.1 aerobic-type carbon monoxide dehydrogenase, middle subunit CoxM/CutM-like protein [Desulfoscipio gibsoniae DSM 7213]
MQSFVHINAHSVDETIRLLAKYEGKAKLNAGGTDLLGVLKDRILPDYPEAVINIKMIPGLNTIEEDGDWIRIGALSPLVDIVKSPIIEKKCPILMEAARTVASPQIRNIATIGGNLCQDTRCWYYRYPDELGGIIKCFRKGGRTCPAVAGENQYHAIMGAKKCFAVCPSDLAVALTALDATITIAGTKGTRNIPVEDFYTHLGNVLELDEMVTMIRVPKPANTKQTFLKFTIRKPIDFAVVSTACMITIVKGICTDVRIVLGAVAHTPVRALMAEEFLKGKELSEGVVTEAATLALAGAKPLSKNEYKLEIAKTLVKRAIMASTLGTE